MKTAPLEAQLRSDVEFLASEIGERNLNHYEALQQARNWIGQVLPSFEEQTYEVDGKEVANIFYAKPGTEADLPPILIGAHYDSAHGTPGADDNASGVAVLLALARHFEGVKMRHSMVFAAFTLEEPPHFRSPDMGSMRFAREWRTQKKPLRLMLCLEMLGFYTEEKIQEFPLPGMGLFYPSRGNFVTVIGHSSPPPDVGRFVKIFKESAVLPAESFEGPRALPGIDFSDHQSFWNHDYPALMVTDTAFYRNKNYHQASDKAGTLNYRAMAEVVESLVRALKAYDQPE